MSQPRNQRISSGKQRKQQHLLDVKIRVGKERERRFRVVSGFILKAILFAGIAAGIWIGGQEGWRHFVWENPDYFIRDPEVKTDGTLTREQILAAAEIVEGRNILTVDLGKSRAALEKLPQVEAAEVARTFPNRVAITISERRPIAWVTQRKDDDPVTSDRSFLIDARSIVLRSRVLLPEYYLLPVISGVETENLVPGQRVGTFDVQAALELVRLNADSTRFQARHIDLSKGYCLLLTDQRRAKITFGFDNIEGQLDRLNQLLDAIEKTGRELHTVNLIPVRNVPVTFYDPIAEAAATEAAAAAAATVAAAKSAPPMPEPKVPKARSSPPPPAPSRSRSAGKKAPSQTRSAEVRHVFPKATPKPAAKEINGVQKRFNLDG